MRHLTTSDFLSGAMFLCIGILGFVFSEGLAFGGPAQPGPGFFPKSLSVLLALAGIVVMVRAVVEAKISSPSFVWRPLVLITAAVSFFAITVDAIGLIVATFLSVMIATFARQGFPTVERVVIAVGLAAFSSVVFIVVLRLPIPLLPT